MLTVLLIICAIMFILALTYIIGCLVAKHEVSTRKKYQDHIDDLVDELFPPSVPDSTLQPIIPVPTPNESDLMYREAKRKMVADIRTYFNQRKINAAIRDAEIKTGLPMGSPIFSTGPTFPTPPSIERMME